MDFEYMKKCFPNYTYNMWCGNEPKNHAPCVNGDEFDNYEDMSTPNQGFCQAYHGECINGEWSFEPYRIFVSNTRQFDNNYHLGIMYNVGDLESYWLYENWNGKCKLKTTTSCKKLPYISESKLRRILNPKTEPKSIAYTMFITKARELFELGDWKGEYRDL